MAFTPLEQLSLWLDPSVELVNSIARVSCRRNFGANSVVHLDPDEFAVGLEKLFARDSVPNDRRGNVKK